MTASAAWCAHGISIAFQYSSQLIETKIEEAFKDLDHEVYKTTGQKSVIPFLKEYLKKTNFLSFYEPVDS